MENALQLGVEGMRWITQYTLILMKMQKRFHPGLRQGKNGSVEIVGRQERLHKIMAAIGHQFGHRFSHQT